MSKFTRKNINLLKAYEPGEQLSGNDIIKLNTNENPYLPSPDVQDILSMVDISVLSKYPDPNSIELRKVISDLHSCDINQVFIGNGSDEILSLIIKAFVEDNESVAFLNPSYTLYSTLADIHNLNKEIVNLNDNFSCILPSEMSAKLFLLANPNAPTSISFTKEDIIKFLKNFLGLVLIDEAYVDFCNWNCMDLAINSKNILVSRSLSKSYSLAGIRCGYCIGHENLITTLYKIKDSYNVSYLSQEIARVALLDQNTMKANVEAIIETRELLREKLTEMGFYVYPSVTNFLWVKPVEITAEKLFNELYKKNILIRYFNDNKTKDYLRITIGTAHQVFSLIDSINEIINGLKND